MVKFYTLFGLILILLLGIRLILYAQNLSSYKENKKVTITTTLLSEPKIRSYFQVFTADNIRVIMPLDQELHYGDQVEIKGRLKKVTRDGGRVRSELILQNPEVKKRESAPGVFLSFIRMIRERMSQVFHQYLPSREAGLLLGVVFGIKEGISPEQYNDFKNTGVVHIIAASGTNVSMIAAFMLTLFTFFFKRRTALIFTLFGILFYAVLGGLEASIVRAALMAGFAYGAGITGRQNASYFGLFFAAYLMILFNPEVMKDIGFQLSFLATLGILLIKPELDKAVDGVYRSYKTYWSDKTYSGSPQEREKKNEEKVAALPFFEDVTATTAAQVLTLPVLAVAFSTYAPISLLVNPLVLWTIPLLMLMGAVAALLAFPLPFLSGIILYLSFPLLLYFETVVRFFSKGASPVNFESIPLTMIMGYYLLVGTGLIFLRRKKGE